MTVARKLILGFAIGPLFLLLIGLVAWGSTRFLLESSVAVLHTYQVLGSVEALESNLAQTHARQRDFLLFGEAVQNEAFKQATAATRSELDRLAQLTSDNPQQQSRIGALRPLLAQRLDQYEGTMDVRRQRGMASATESVQANLAGNLDGQIRDWLQLIVQDEQVLLERRNKAADDIANFTIGLVTYGTAIALLLLAVAGFYIIRGINRPVRGAIAALSNATSEILAGTAEQAAGMRQQTTAVAQTVSTVDEVLQTSEQAAQRARLVAEAAQRAVEVSDAGRKSVEEAIGAMDVVRTQGAAVADSIVALAEQAQAIGEIIAAVTDIADQTNILALNAAIEASRAGEHGRGFAVVAAEIKALADQSKRSTQQIRQILNDIQKATGGAVMATERGTKSMGDALRTVSQADETIRTLADTIADAAQVATQIAASASQQVTGMSQIHQAMTHISQASNQNLAATRQSEAAAQTLSQLGARLRQMISGTDA